MALELYRRRGQNALGHDAAMSFDKKLRGWGILINNLAKQAFHNASVLKKSSRPHGHIQTQSLIRHHAWLHVFITTFLQLLGSCRRSGS